MNNSFKEIFGQIKAEEELKDNTLEFISRKTHGYEKARNRHPKRLYYAVACAVCVIMLFFGGYTIYFSADAQISVDINPSIELNINCFNRVISVKEFNDDGKKLANEIDVKHKKYSAAITEIMNNDTIKKLMTDDEALTFTVACSNESKSTEILSKLEKCTKEKNNTYCYSATYEDAEKAHNLGISCGKYKAYIQLHKINPNITVEEVQSMTMREIRELTNSYLSSDEDNTKPYHQENNLDRHQGEGQSHSNKNRQNGKKRNAYE